MNYITSSNSHSDYNSDTMSNIFMMCICWSRVLNNRVMAMYCCSTIVNRWALHQRTAQIDKFSCQLASQLYNSRLGSGLSRETARICYENLFACCSTTTSHLLNWFYNIHSFHNMSKNNMLAIQPVKNQYFRENWVRV